MSDRLSRIASAAQMLRRELDGMNNAEAGAVNAVTDPAMSGPYYLPLALAGALASLGDPPSMCPECDEPLILVVGGNMRCRNESQGRHAETGDPV